MSNVVRGSILDVSYFDNLDAIRKTIEQELLSMCSSLNTRDHDRFAANKDTINRVCREDVDKECHNFLICLNVDENVEMGTMKCSMMSFVISVKSGKYSLQYWKSSYSLQCRQGCQWVDHIDLGHDLMSNVKLCFTDFCMIDMMQYLCKIIS